MAPTKKFDKNGLHPKVELFCKYYISDESFANGVQSYARAYGVDLEKEPQKHHSCRTRASELLKRPEVCKRIEELLDLSGLNDSFVDKQLTFVITQHADLHAKIAAINSYNKLKQRITDKVKVEHEMNFDNLSVEEKKQLFELMKKAGG